MINRIFSFSREVLERQDQFFSLRSNLKEVELRFNPNKSLEKYLRRIKRNLDIDIKEKDLELIQISDLYLDWELTVEGIYIYGGGYIGGLSTAIAVPPTSRYEDIACEHENFTTEQEQFLKEETNWFCKSAHGDGDGSYGIFHRTKDKFPFDILYLDNGCLFNTDFTLETYYQSLIDSMGVCGWQYFYLDFQEIVKGCKDFEVGNIWLTLYPNEEIAKTTPRIEAVVFHMEKCIKVLPEIFPDEDFSYHEQRLEDFKVFLSSQ